MGVPNWGEWLLEGKCNDGFYPWFYIRMTDPWPPLPVNWLVMDQREERMGQEWNHINSPIRNCPQGPLCKEKWDQRFFPSVFSQVGQVYPIGTQTMYTAAGKNILK